MCGGISNKEEPNHVKQYVDTYNWDQDATKYENIFFSISSFHDILLQAGDTITLIKDLNVKGASFTAKRGTAVRNISLVHDNPEHIEGRVEGQQIVILTKFVKKS